MLYSNDAAGSGICPGKVLSGAARCDLGLQTAYWENDGAAHFAKYADLTAAREDQATLTSLPLAAET